ncbi:hypothetical protein A584_17715 [Pseudomonas syringae pv. theae ICMP 3923]|uniref:ABC-three component systems C-terminal domain-containing protein n=1 Tax=Pseudomonas syringae pv. theae TaxID=103985 RepID=A0A0Q0FQK3_PSESX|nr:ABC-three component system protein [Pseudomonas syringae]EPM68508.1 hypothetical protein A584_17715 [Pseudomonas syringae pv. theae ICMP 3923]KPZ31103.1 hypothetical protein AN901_202727 [Pseudomonas syringae pv. theae]MBL3872654.1 hypothetical protein [Pseudomonas syringae pv. theae]RMT72154.1 hypothetical protein ALP44_03952 [Pseudomonas syringae pv. theae]GKQ32145.1 hypothetical protein PSTH68_21520 [Pseudomonas syringae pv. theae]
MAYDASPSWSGFNYQGKVAIYYALTLINKCLSTNLNFDFSNHALILENTEDFEIIVSKNTISFHQVKALQGSSFSDYENALFGMAIELHKKPTAIGYIHSWRKINPNANKTLSESIAQDFLDVSAEYANAKDKTKTIIGKVFDGSPKPDKKTAIMRLALCTTTETEIVKILADIGNKTNATLTRLNSYTYPDGNDFCDLLEINIKIQSELSAAFINTATFNSQKQIQNAFCHFLGAIDNYIAQRHLQKANTELLTIPFNEIMNIIKIDFEDVSEAYLKFRFKNSFLEQFDEFMSFPNLYSHPGANSGLECNLLRIRAILSNLTPEILWEHYKCFTPHQAFESSNNLDTAFNVNMEGVLMVLLKIFYEIDYKNTIHMPGKFRLVYRTLLRPGDQYLPTTITSSNFPERIARGIIANPNMIETLFEVSTLIYEGALIEKLPSQLHKHVSAPAGVGDEIRERREDILSNLRLISTAQAKEEINAN